MPDGWPRTVTRGPLAGNTYNSRSEYRAALYGSRGFHSESEWDRFVDSIRLQRGKHRERRGAYTRREVSRGVRSRAREVFPSASRDTLSHAISSGMDYEFIERVERQKAMWEFAPPGGIEWSSWIDYMAELYGEWVYEFPELFYYHESE